MDSASIFGILLIASSRLVPTTIAIPKCDQELDRGNGNCSNPEKSIKYHFDSKLESCFPFLYEGCGGGENRFESYDNCMTRCRPADKGICGGGSPALGSCSSRKKACPSGSKCVLMAFGIGLCCDIKIQGSEMFEFRKSCPEARVCTKLNEKEYEILKMKKTPTVFTEMWLKENHPKCSNASDEIVTEQAWYGEQEVLGKSCEHKFCPAGSKCVDGRWLAYCCQKKTIKTH